MITQIENELIEKNRDKLLRILLEKEYRQYVSDRHTANFHSGSFNETHRYIILDFYEWMEEILQDI